MQNITYYSLQIILNIYRIGITQLSYIAQKFIIGNSYYYIYLFSLQTIVICCWIVSLFTLAAAIVGAHYFNRLNFTAEVLNAAFFESFVRVSWAIALSWIIFACVRGYGGPVNWMLSWPQWQPLARISYSLYLVHIPVQAMYRASMRSPKYLSNATGVLTFLFILCFYFLNI